MLHQDPGHGRNISAKSEQSDGGAKSEQSDGGIPVVRSTISVDTKNRVFFF